MSDTLPPRPTFSNGQYIGAADLNASVAYSRDEVERLALSGRTWGIVTGLALVERATTGTGVEMFIEPGIAYDGFGRQIVVLSPAPVTPDLFAGLFTGNQQVWLSYQATQTQQVQPGFQSCGAGDPATRVAESYTISAGAAVLTQQTSGIVIGGASIPDPRNMLNAVDTAAPVVLDGSAAHQSFPGDTGVWLIPIGIVNYVSGSPGSFAKRSAAQLFLSRSFRCYTGCFAETLLAADGVLRLRDRQTDQAKNVTNDQLAATAAIQQTDFNPDPNNPARLIGNELVWVEGNLRVTGNARMYGSQLELRDQAGQDYGVPEFLRRGSSAGNLKNGQDLQICIGDSNTGTAGYDRLTIGWLAKSNNPPSTLDPSPSTAPDGAIQEVMVVRTDGRAAIGTNAIDFYDPKANILVVATGTDSGITIASDSNSTGNVFFADGGSTTGTTSAQKDGYVSYDHGKQQMNLGAGAATVMSLTAAGQTVIGPANPSKFASDANQLIVSGTGSCGITIATEKGDYATINFADTASSNNSGYIKYQADTGHMWIGTASADRIFLDDKGNAGIGTDSPSAPLTIASGSYSLNLNPPNIQAMKGSSPTPLLFQPQGESIGIGLSGTSPGATLHVRTYGNSQSLIVDTVNPDSTAISTLGNKVGIGFSGTPQTTLDVRGVAIPAGTTEAGNVAMVENLLPVFANVLGLKVGGTFSLLPWNYITFYDGSKLCLGRPDTRQTCLVVAHPVRRLVTAACAAVLGVLGRILASRAGQPLGEPTRSWRARNAPFFDRKEQERHHHRRVLERFPIT